MALVPQVSQLHIRDAATATLRRGWVATAAVLDTAAGSSVVVTVEQTTSGATPPEVPDELELSFRADNGSTVVSTAVLTPGSASQTHTFHFTDTGASGGSPRAGTVRMRIRAARTGGVNQYDATSDNGQFGSAANNYPPGFTGGTIDWGWIRGTTTLVEDISNTSLGGAPSAPAEYDESLFVRTVTGHVSYVARALTVALSAGSVSGATSSTTAAQRDVTFTAVCDDRFPAALTTVGVAVTVPNATLTTVADWTYSATTDDTITVDPRLTAAHHFQVDDDVFALVKHDATKQMLSTQSGFLWSRLTAARGTGVNSLTVTQTLDPANPGTTVSASSSTATRDGQAGWTDKLDWTAAKPGGSWAKTVDVTAPADIDADTYLLSGTDTVTMLNTDPRISVMVRVGPATATEDRHLQPGDPVKVAVSVFNRGTRVRLAPDAAPVVALVRYDLTSGWQYLSTGGTWTAWGAGAADATTMTVETDALSYAHTFASTGWGATDLVAVQVAFTYQGTPYGFYVGRELSGSANIHDGYALDPVALGLHGVLSMR